jgi:hypothetical protein
MHAGCCGIWSGLGLHVICSCSCHDKKELEMPFQGNPSSSRQSSSGEDATTDGE